MIRRLRLAWPQPAVPGSPPNRPIRLLAVSDERAAALDHPANRAVLAPLDAVLGCGDLDPDYLAFLGDAFRAPLLYVRGNHDRGAAWSAGQDHLPHEMDGGIARVADVRLVGLSWP
ncbi:MAG: hypothetical protein M3N29_00620, partial [Chloroflexota bacterium]|nr:hypothetical protein [Chloroflexota bacterium]